MDYALVVRVAHRLAYFEQHTKRAGLVPDLLASMHKVKHVAQVIALDQSHREVDAPIARETEIMHWHDARMTELPRDLRLFQKPVQSLRFVGAVSPGAGAVSLSSTTFMASVRRRILSHTLRIVPMP